MKRTASRALALIAISLLCAGCQGIVRQGVDRVIHQPICPVCKSTSIDSCHCFPETASAGYCETSWASLQPLMEEGFYAPHESLYLDAQPDSFPSAEEIPTPEKLLDQQIKAEPSSGDPPPEARPVEQEAVRQRDQVTQPAKREKRLAVSLRLDDTEEPVSNQP
jgi:hypothetical protein